MSGHALQNAILFLFIVLLVALLSPRRKPRYRQQPILTANEAEFFRRVGRALPDVYIFPQVAMSALITPKSKGKAGLTDFRLISQKRVDFAVYTAGLELLAVVELDDRTHNRARDAKRDAFLDTAGIRTVRLQSRNKPDEREIRVALLSPR
ncbi:DUF2726 domain-containing protein [Paraburkholderia sp. EG286B]|uniref:DUF2726 domain-containing protein n=1 Tax=Paraburkholderia sp. EG286B TaxID=3237011 RepID=UPI0034D264EF